MNTTPSLLASAAEPVASVPTRFPCTNSPVEAWIRIPSPALEEMTFPAPAAVTADRVARGAVEASTPEPPLPWAMVPVSSRPIKLPCTRLPVAEAPVISTPLPVFAMIPLPGFEGSAAYRPADRVAGGIRDLHAVQVGINDVAQHQIACGRGAGDLDTVAGVCRDVVAV